MNDKKFEKVAKKLGEEMVRSLEELADQQLKARIVMAEQAKEEAEAELEANPKFQELKEALKDLTSAKREINSRQNAIISMCVHLLDKMGNGA